MTATPADTSGLVTTVDGSATITPKELRRRARAWAMWDVGNSAWQAVVVTFVFATYLASDLFLDPAIVEFAKAPEGSEGHALYLAAQAETTSLIANLDAIAAVLVAVISPALGAKGDTSGGRKRSLLILSLLTVGVMLAMFFVFPDQSFLFFGALLLAVGVVFSEFAGVSYDAMLSQVSTKETVVWQCSHLSFPAGHRPSGRRWPFSKSVRKVFAHFYHFRHSILKSWWVEWPRVLPAPLLIWWQISVPYENHFRKQI